MNELRIGHADYALLRDHLLRPDRDEHGALLLAGGRERADGSLVLTVREVHPLTAEEFPPGRFGYRQFGAGALARLGNRAADERLTLVTVHSHPGAAAYNALSADDLQAHERVFPHLLDITAADAVAGVALGEGSVAGEIWRGDGSRSPLGRLRVIGPNLVTFRPAPVADALQGTERFDRQVRLFGEQGQQLLRDLHVAVIGAGGGGSILLEQLVHLGVGTITAIDPDIVERHNLSRIMGATDADARAGATKVSVAARQAKRIDPSIDFRPVVGDIADDATARLLVEADYLLLAADTATARLVANAVAQTFLIPLVQIGAKVDTRDDGTIEQIYTAVRPVLPRYGCLSCAGLINPDQLQREAATSEERAAQNYLGDADVVDPSVTTLNAAAAAGALNVLLMSVIGQADPALSEHRITLTREGATLVTHAVGNPGCRWCGTGSTSRYGRADAGLLPCRPSPDAPRARISRLRRFLDRRPRDVRRHD